MDLWDNMSGSLPLCHPSPQPESLWQTCQTHSLGEKMSLTHNICARESEFDELKPLKRHIYSILGYIFLSVLREVCHVWYNTQETHACQLQQRHPCDRNCQQDEKKKRIPLVSLHAAEQRARGASSWMDRCSLQPDSLILRPSEVQNLWFRVRLHDKTISAGDRITSIALTSFRHILQAMEKIYQPVSTPEQLLKSMAQDTSSTTVIFEVNMPNYVS